MAIKGSVAANFSYRVVSWKIKNMKIPFQYYGVPSFARSLQHVNFQSGYIWHAYPIYHPSFLPICPTHQKLRTNANATLSVNLPFSAACYLTMTRFLSTNVYMLHTNTTETLSINLPLVAVYDLITTITLVSFLRSHIHSLQQIMQLQH